MKYIKLTDLSGTTVLVNMDKITEVYADDRYIERLNEEARITILVSAISKCYELFVKETPEEIWQMLNKGE